MLCGAPVRAMVCHTQHDAHSVPSVAHLQALHDAAVQRGALRALHQAALDPRVLQSLTCCWPLGRVPAAQSQVRIELHDLPGEAGGPCSTRVLQRLVQRCAKPGSKLLMSVQEAALPVSCASRPWIQRCCSARRAGGRFARALQHCGRQRVKILRLC